MKSKQTKKALLVSTLSLVLCLALLVGATFAWFTDSVTSGKNTIVAGNLDVELEYTTDFQTWTAVDANTSLFADSVLWEPGHTEVVYLRVRNAGTLALKYQFAVNVVSETEGTNVAGETFKLSDYLVFGQAEGQNAAFANREAAWEAAGTAMGLKDYSKEDHLLANAEEYVALVVYMPTTVGNEANYRGEKAPTIELGVTLLATQDTVESDSFDNQYDKDAAYPVYSAESLKKAIEEINASETINSAIIAVTQDFVYHDETLTVENGKNVTIDLAGHNLTIINSKQDGLFVTGGATLSLTNSVAGSGKYVFDCTYHGADSIYVYNNAEGQTTTLNIANPVQIEINAAANSAFHAYGEKGNAVINIQDGTNVKVTGSNVQTSAVIVDQNATFNMNGGNFELNVDFDSYSDNNDVVGVVLWGQNGEQRNNTFHLSGGTFKVGGKNAFAQAVQIGMKNGDSESCKADITGGSIVLNPTEDGEGYAFTAYKASYGKFTMSGGSVSGNLDAITTTAYSENADLTVTGGTFSMDPSAYVDLEHYSVANDGSTWTVTSK